MAYTRWKVTVDGAPHTLEVDHNFASTQRWIWVDGRQVPGNPKGSFEAPYPIQIGTATAILWLKRRGFLGAFYYALELDGSDLPPAEGPEDALLRPAAAAGHDSLLRPASGVRRAKDPALLHPSRPEPRDPPRS